MHMARKVRAKLFWAVNITLIGSGTFFPNPLPKLLPSSKGLASQSISHSKVIISIGSMRIVLNAKKYLCASCGFAKCIYLCTPKRASI